MEIITESRLIEAGVKRTLELIADSKSSNQVVADAANQKLKGNLDIVIRIKPDIEIIQIFPIDLTDFIFILEGKDKPKFISKLTRQGQHFIGKIIDTAYGDIKLLVNKGFFDIFGPDIGYKADRCWFIKLVDMPASKTQIKQLAIHLFSTDDRKPHCEYAYINQQGEFIISQGSEKESTIDKKTFELTVDKWFQKTSPSQGTLFEASGGIEVTAEKKALLERLQKSGWLNLALIEPRFARTPEDLFSMFMAD